MSDFNGEVMEKVVKVRIIKASQPTYWYADQIGKTVQAIKHMHTDNDGTTSTDWLVYPRARGFEPSRHFDNSDVEEV